jgi:signal peptidase
MSGSKNNPEKPSLLTALRTSEEQKFSLARDLIWVVGVVGGIALLLFLVTGTWPAVVTIESESMTPNMNVGDLVLVVQQDRFGALETLEDGALTGYGKYNSLLNNSGQKVYGDVIIYRPNGDTAIHPIIHRAIRYVNDSVAAATYHASHGGYITKGDHNTIEDQQGGLAGIGQIQPVKPEWVVGKVFFVVPLVGLLPLHLPEVVVVVVVLMLGYELYLRSRRDESGDQKRKKGKRGR